MLANFYLNPFDQSMMSRCDAYLRYSDDIVFWSDSFEKAETISQKLVEYLKSKLELTLNAEPEIISSSKPMEFLGLMISPSEISMTQDKINELEDKIYNIELHKGVPSKLYQRNIDGIKRYFLTVLPSKYKEVFSGILQNVYARWNENGIKVDNKTFEDIRTRILGKLKNQANLCKYYNKYHKHKGIEFAFDDCMAEFMKVVIKVKQLPQSDDFKVSMMAYEARGAELYWEYIRELLYDDNVEFYSRVKQGAKDLMNCMLNYGYGLLYPKVWQALLRHGLNPYVGFVHYASNNPNLVFDFIELFRSQVVDRVVIGMIQKKVKCSVDGDGRLSDETRNLLTERILERLYRYEPFRNEKRTMIDIIDIQAYELSCRIMDGQKFKPYVFKW